MSEIRVGAIFHATRKELSKFSREDIQRNAIKDLSMSLSCHINNKAGIFETKEVEGGLQFRAECYVLTPNDFSRLVKKIQQDLMRFGHTPMIGGGCS